MRRAMTRINPRQPRPTTTHGPLAPASLRGAPRRALRPWVAIVAAVVLGVACGEEDSGTDAGPVYTLDIKVADAAGDTGGWTFSNDTQPGEDSVETGADATDATVDASTQADGQSDSASEDTAAPAIVSCEGKCGLKLETNPCHCDHACVGRNDCCPDFQGACGCESKAQCDDGNDCTTDSCQDARGGAKFCKQVPFFGCCNSDAECGAAGQNKCIKPTCLQGSCTDVQKDCDDGVDCTIDSCDPATGECKHKLSAVKCLVDGACHGAGASKPGSGGCMLCQPDKDQNAWTAKAGTCLVDGLCKKSGEKATTAPDECRVCNPAVSGDTWSVSSGSCYIDGKCFAGGAGDPKNPTCATCQPSKNPKAWSGVAGKCAVDGVCYDTGAGDPKLDCAVCDPATSSSSLTPKTGWCVIDGACVQGGASKPGSFGCQTCNAATSPSTWTSAKTGSTCSDDDACTISTTCSATGTCVGKTKPNCCKEDADCVGQVNPSTCEKAVCKGDGSCAIEKDTDCCSSGVCCDVGAGKLKPLGTPCSSFKLSSQYKCEGNTGYKRDLYPGCTGIDASKCSQLQPAGGPWQQYKTCSGGTKCSLSSTTSPPVCKS